MKKEDYFMKNVRLIVACLVVVAVALTFTACDKNYQEEPSPLSAIQNTKEHGMAISGKYIVVFKVDVDFGLNGVRSYDMRQDKMRQAGKGILKGKGIPEIKLTHVYANAIKGMAVGLTKAELARLNHDPRIAYIEEDRIIALAPPSGKGPNKGGSTQEVPWGIQRVGGPGNGTGKTAWVLDTGIDLKHPELNVDEERSISMYESGFDPELEVLPEDRTPHDTNGHGTHVSGTIAAKNDNVGVVGVAADATVVAVKVLTSRGMGTLSAVIGGVDYVAASGRVGDVANMSLGGAPSQALDDAVIAAANTGIKFVLAAGNGAADANNMSPARVNGPNIYTISALDRTEWLANFSNWGNPPIDYAAPGVHILSTWINGEYKMLNGTSMAAPHVAGLLLLGELGTNCYVKGDPDGNPDPIAYRGDKKCNPNKR